MDKKCIQNVHKIYPTFWQTLWAATFLFIRYKKNMQKFVKMWDTFCIHFLSILHTSVVYILYNFCIQPVYMICFCGSNGLLFKALHSQSRDYAQNYLVAARSTQPCILPRWMKWVPGTPCNLVVKSKLSDGSGSVVLKQLYSIHKRR